MKQGRICRHYSNRLRRGNGPNIHWTIALVAVLLGFLGTQSAFAQEDSRGHYRPDPGQWQGISDFVALAAESGINVDLPERLDPADLTETDAVLILHPTSELPHRALRDFLRSGGRLAIADDFGAGDSFLAGYGITRIRPPIGETFRDNPALLVARPHAQHPLLEDVPFLLTNHPQALRHAELSPVLVFGALPGQRPRQSVGLVLAGAIERGRLVAIGDPSIFIDGMLSIPGNRQFARNLLAYLDAGAGSRVLIVTPQTELVGGEGTGQPLAKIQQWLRDAAGAHTPSAAFTIFVLTAVSVFGIVLASSFPRQSPYTAARLLQRPTNYGGFAGRVELGSESSDVGHALRVYKFEFEAEVARFLGVPASRNLGEAARRLGDPKLQNSLLALLRELQAHLIQEDQEGSQLSRRQFERLVDRGEALLQRLQDKR